MHYINHLLTYLLTYLLTVNRSATRVATQKIQLIIRCAVEQPAMRKWWGWCSAQLMCRTVAYWNYSGRTMIQRRAWDRAMTGVRSTDLLSTLTMMNNRGWPRLHVISTRMSWRRGDLEGSQLRSNLLPSSFMQKTTTSSIFIKIQTVTVALEVQECRVLVG